MYCIYLCTDEHPALLIYAFPKQSLPSFHLVQMVAGLQWGWATCGSLFSSSPSHTPSVGFLWCVWLRNLVQGFATKAEFVLAGRNEVTFFIVIWGISHEEKAYCCHIVLSFNKIIQGRIGLYPFFSGPELFQKPNKCLKNNSLNGSWVHLSIHHHFPSTEYPPEWRSQLRSVCSPFNAKF